MLSFDPTAYHGQSITPANLVELSRPGLSPDDEAKVLTFFYNNPEIVEKVVQQKPAMNEFKNFHASNKELLTKAGARLLSSNNNYIFQIPNLDTVATKVSGEVSRFINLMVGLKGYRRAEASLNWLPEFHVSREIEPTYQTASEAATALRIQEFVENHPSCGIVPIPTHLVPLPGCPADAADRHSVVVKKFVDIKPLNSIEDKMIYLTPERVAHLVHLTKWAGLWELSDTNICVDGKGNLYCPDGEQPDNSNPKDFYHKNQKKILWNSGCGIESLYNILPDHSEQRAVVRSGVIGDSDYTQSDYYPTLTNKFAQNP